MARVVKTLGCIQWSVQETQQFLKVAYEAGEGVMYEFALSTGVRQGEILALLWSDIDFERQTVTVGKSLSSYTEEKEGMTKIKGVRTLPLPTNLLPILKKHQQYLERKFGQYFPSRLDLVFPDKVGGVQNIQAMRQRFKRLIEQAGLRVITYNDFRKMHLIQFLVNDYSSFELINESICSDPISYIYLQPNTDGWKEDDEISVRKPKLQPVKNRKRKNKE
ncbi:tyrosine-type recombinase/integrase [Rossellomorea aquimaris]|uniref:Phage integrase family protein n=1 Tax=Rossellomorea aquimaris TaxID=189382 RepID=A0A366EFX2_9BACI|nr:tyrosine-type recombinase/integrase [Rossellomorea aquimaris]RBP01228.1 phage integrase family protein [Rossellomorea aquimaris]